MIITIIGLIISFVGTVLVAVSIKRGKVGMYMNSPKEMEYAGNFNTPILKWGLGLLALGFLLQIWGASLQ